MSKVRFRCVCAYDGTDFYGWQSQVGGNTVQDFIEARLAAIFKEPVRIHGAGRTDSGVHAKAQVFHFDAHWAHPVADLERALSNGYPAGIQVAKVRKASADFHARFSAKGKRYTYRLFLGDAPPMETRYCWSLGKRSENLDTEAMQKAAAYLIGTHNFSAFSATHTQTEKENPVKELRKLTITKKGRRVNITTEGSGYLYKMVRSIAGTLVEVGLDKLSPQDVQRILEGQQRTRDVPTAPAKGLCLEKVFYEHL